MQVRKRRSVWHRSGFAASDKSGAACKATLAPSSPCPCRVDRAPLSLPPFATRPGPVPGAPFWNTLEGELTHRRLPLSPCAFSCAHHPPRGFFFATAQTRQGKGLAILLLVLLSPLLVGSSCCCEEAQGLEHARPYRGGEEEEEGGCMSLVSSEGWRLQ